MLIEENITIIGSDRITETRFVLVVVCKLLICYKIFLLVDYLEWYQQFRGQVNI